MIGTITDFKTLFLSDARRYLDDTTFEKCQHKGMIGCLSTSRIAPGLKYSYWMRLCYVLRGKKAWLPFYAFALNRFNHYQYKFGISIPFITKIDRGFYIGHFGCIVVNQGTVIGKNCNISQGVTIGEANRGKNKGCAIIGDNVYIGPGAKIVGHVVIGNNVAIGANAVVTHDVPDNAVVGGIPASIISMNGSEGYVNRKVE